VKKSLEKPESDWRKELAGDVDPDDAELASTPPDVVAVLGFDPAAEGD
jgi:hypothetical protein